jgi:hypothetical protein
VSLLHEFSSAARLRRAEMGTQALSMDAELGISKWAIAALVAAMIVVGAMGLVLRGGAAQDPAANRAPAADAPAQSH